MKFTKKRDAYRESMCESGGRVCVSQEEEYVRVEGRVYVSRKKSICK